MKDILTSLTAGESLTDQEIKIAMEHLFSDESVIVKSPHS